MNPVHDATYPKFLEYWQEQFNVNDIYIRISPGPEKYTAWAASRTMLETCLDKAGVEEDVDYNLMPHWPVEWFEPSVGATALEAAQGAVEAYERALADPEKKILMNVGCVAIAEQLSRN